MGVSSGQVVPMSTCIELLSSDDECEIIGEPSSVNRPSFSNLTCPPIQQEKNAIQKLQRNSNIELTINLENVFDETSDSPSVTTHLSSIQSRKNGFIQNKPDQGSEQQNKIKRDISSTSIVPDIVIIDDDPPSTTKIPNKPGTNGSKDVLKPFFGPQHLPQTSRNSLNNSGNIRNSMTNPSRKGINNPPLRGINTPPGRGINIPPGRGVNTPPTRGINTLSARGIHPPPTRGINIPPVRGINCQPVRGINTPPGRGINTPPVRGINTPPVRGIYTPPVRGINTPPVRGINTAPVRGINNPPVRGINTPPVRGINTPSVRRINPTPVRGINTPSVRRINPTPAILKKNINPSVKTGTSTNILNKNTLQTDVVYIIDDASDEETENEQAKVQLKSPIKVSNQPSNSRTHSHTEKIVNILREKIDISLKTKRESFTNLTNKPIEKVVSKSPEEKQNGRSPSKKRSNPDQIVSSQEIPKFLENETRVTRSSVSSSSSSSQAKQSTSKYNANEKRNKPSALDIRNQPMNKYSIENMFSGLVSICNKIFTDDKLESKLWNTFRQASENVLRSEEFISALKIALNSSEQSKIETLDEKLEVQRHVKEVIRIMKRHPVVVDKKVKKLTKMLNVIRGRIKKLEEAEVTSDEDGEENPYVLLDRYRTRAAKIYEKICELQNESPHAGRAIKQRFTFSGSSGYPKIEQALQKFYLKTKTFPDFMDVKKLVEITVKRENMDIPAHKIQTIAQSVFIEFGNRLQRMRLFDEYSIMNEYLEDGRTKDPALDNEGLFNSLAKWDSSKRIREGEQKIFQEFSNKEIEQKTKEDNKSEESDYVNEASDDDETTENKIEKQEDLHLSDTDEELINSDVKEKRKSCPSEDDDEDNPKKKSRVAECTMESKSDLTPIIDLNNLLIQSSSSNS